VWIDKDALAEVDAIIEMMPEENAVKIPKKLREFLRVKKSATYIPSIRKDIPLYRQPLKEDTRTMCSLIYRAYLCTPEEKMRLENKDKEILVQNSKEQVEMYHFNGALEKNKMNEVVTVDLAKYDENNELVKCNEQRWIKRIFNKILSCFRKF